MSFIIEEQMQNGGALIVHPTVNIERAKQQFDNFVLPWLPFVFKCNAALIIAEYCMESVYETAVLRVQNAKQCTVFGRHLDGKGSHPLEYTILEDIGHEHWIAGLNRDVVLCEACKPPVRQTLKQ